MKLRLERILLAIPFLLAACASPSAPPPSTSTTAPPTPTRTTIATPSPSLAPTPTRTPSPLISNPQVVVLATNLPGPDDLLLAPDGSIYLSDVSDGTIRRYTPASGLHVYLSGFNEPEGMVLLPDGSLIIAEQGTNRLVRFDPNTRSLTPFLNLRNTTTQAGVDGIVLDNHNPGAPTLIVPDSPNGTVLRLTLDGKTLTPIASGFVRPTGAWVEPDGSVLVVDEYGNSLDRIRPDGTVEKLEALPTPDDVIEDSEGNIFVNTLGDNAIHVIAAGTQTDRILAGGLGGPQGIIFDSDGNLIVTDPTSHQLLKLVIH